MVTAICGGDIDFFKDGNKSILVVGFQSGQIEVRQSTGEIVHTTKVEGNGAIAKIFFYDYRMSGQKQVIVVTTTGRIQGYQVTQNLKQYDMS